MTGALAFCEICGLWLDDRESCLHIGPRASCDPTTPDARATSGGSLPPSAPAHLLDNARGKSADALGCAVSVPLHSTLTSAGVQRNHG